MRCLAQVARLVVLAIGREVLDGHLLAGTHLVGKFHRDTLQRHVIVNPARAVILVHIPLIALHLEGVLRELFEDRRTEHVVHVVAVGREEIDVLFAAVAVVVLKCLLTESPVFIALVGHFQRGSDAVGHFQRSHILELLLLAVHRRRVGLDLAHGSGVDVAQVFKLHVAVVQNLDALHLIHDGRHQRGKLTRFRVGVDADLLCSVHIAAQTISTAAHVLRGSFDPNIRRIGLRRHRSARPLLAHRVEQIAVDAQDDFGSTDVVLAQPHTQRLAHFQLTAGHTSGNRHQRTVLEAQVLHLFGKGLVCAHSARVGGEASLVAEHVSILAHLDIVVADGHRDLIVTFRVAHDGLAVLAANRAVHIEVATVHGIGRVGEGDLTAHLERRNILEIHRAVVQRLAVHKARQALRIELMAALARRDRIARAAACEGHARDQITAVRVRNAIHTQLIGRRHHGADLLARAASASDFTVIAVRHIAALAVVVSRGLIGNVLVERPVELQVLLRAGDDPIVGVEDFLVAQLLVPNADFIDVSIERPP